MRGRIYTLALSDLSIIELAAIVVGIITSASGFLFLLLKIAYMAGLSASPINPVSGITGYVAGLGIPAHPLSFSAIRHAAAKIFLSMIYSSKLEFWLIFMVSLFVTMYPLSLRFKTSLIPCFSIMDKSIDYIILVFLLPVILITTGYVWLFVIMTWTIYSSYFGITPDMPFLLSISSITLFMLFVALFYYDALVVTGKPYLGGLIGFLLSLGMDKISPPLTILLIIDVMAIILCIVFLVLSIRRRWFAL